jgi:hypothetical protein
MELMLSNAISKEDDLKNIQHIETKLNVSKTPRKEKSIFFGLILT